MPIRLGRHIGVTNIETPSEEEARAYLLDLARRARRTEAALARAAELARTGLGRDIRIRSGLSQVEVARALGIGQNAVSRWERGLNSPVSEAGARWAAVMDALAALQGEVDHHG